MLSILTLQVLVSWAHYQLDMSFDKILIMELEKAALYIDVFSHIYGIDVKLVLSHT